jgi:nicotinate-nucleotide adenylyltransferase
MRLGIYGGTFDPPHVGHLVLAAEALEQLELDRVLWVLTPDPPHKQGQYISPASLRLEMLQAAIQDNPAFELSRVDLDRPSPHYALDTMRLLRSQYPNDAIIYLMGGDSLEDLPNWHSPVEFVAECDSLGVMLRPGTMIDIPELDKKIPGVGEKVCFVGTPLLEISASDIRKRVQQGRHYRYYLPEGVYEVIEARQLYR